MWSETTFLIHINLLELLGVLLALKAVWQGLRPKTMVLVRSVNTTVVTV